jgi:hypothetical protein
MSCFRHGLRQTYLYQLWCNIKQRCLNVNDEHYPRYGARGIRICDEWRDSPEAFASYILAELGHRPTPSHSIDRIENNGNYEPGNLRWATRSQQQRNKRKFTYGSYRLAHTHPPRS